MRSPHDFSLHCMAGAVWTLKGTPTVQEIEIHKHVQRFIMNWRLCRRRRRRPNLNAVTGVPRARAAKSIFTAAQCPQVQPHLILRLRPQVHANFKHFAVKKRACLHQTKLQGDANIVCGCEWLEGEMQVAQLGCVRSICRPRHRAD